MSTRQLTLTVAMISVGWMAPNALHAASVYYVNFDQGVQSPGPNPYSAMGAEVLPAGITGINNTPGDSVSGNLVDPPVTGPQGGQALQMLRGAAWPNTQGYRFGGDGAYYDEPTGPVIDTNWTIEALVNPDYTDTGFGLYSQAQIFNAQNLLGDDSWGDFRLMLDQNTGIVTFDPAAVGIGPVSSTTALQAGQWYHIAGVVRDGGPGGPQQTELWINGVLEGTGGYPEGWETLFRVPGYFNVGSSYWPLGGRNFQGYIDAFAISDTALDANSFVLTPVPEPASMTLLVVGCLVMVGRCLGVKLNLI